MLGPAETAGACASRGVSCRFRRHRRRFLSSRTIPRRNVRREPGRLWHRPATGLRGRRRPTRDDRASIGQIDPARRRCAGRSFGSRCRVRTPIEPAMDERSDHNQSASNEDSVWLGGPMYSKPAVIRSTLPLHRWPRPRCRVPSDGPRIVRHSGERRRCWIIAG
jgi:hypothetical protein